MKKFAVVLNEWDDEVMFFGNADAQEVSDAFWDGHRIKRFETEKEMLDFLEKLEYNPYKDED